MAFLIYGANGYTGQLAAEHAVERGLRPVLAGRSRDKLDPLAERLGLETRVFGLDAQVGVREGIQGMTAVLHAAGPFSATSAPMAEACIRSGIHYLDITGEVAVFEALAERHGDAKSAGVMLLPGAGFDVVPSDCLAAHVKQRMPGATRLRLSIGGLGKVSRGTTRTMIESLKRGTLVRRDAKIVELSRPPRATADFGDGPTPTIGVTWGDVSTAWHSTHIPDVEVYFQASPALEKGASMSPVAKWFAGTPVGQWLLKRKVDQRPPGPTPEQRARGGAVIIAEAWDADGTHIASRLTTPEGYTLTAHTAVEIARRADSGEAVPGFQTPSRAYGADFILSFNGVQREDL